MGQCTRNGSHLDRGRTAKTDRLKKEAAVAMTVSRRTLPSAGQRNKLNYAKSRAWSRLRVQLGGALLFAVAVPSLAFTWLVPSATLNAYNQNLIGMAVAVCLSLYVLRNITIFPGIRTGYSVLPSVLIGYGIVFAILLFFRLDYGRALLLISMIASLAWFYLANFMAARGRGMRFAVAPFGDVGSLVTVQSIEWVWLSEPAHTPGRYDALVADFRKDLPDEWEAFLANCALGGVPVFHVKQLRESLTGRVEIEHLSENSFGSLVPFMAYLRLRWLLDFIAAVLAAIILAPLFLVVAAAIKLESPGPVFFRQRRIGYRGEPFMMTKFRTMQHHRVAATEELDGAKTRQNDERVTRVGRFLRRTRIDELPQILNILKGEMSWIGPRPEAEVLSRWYESELPFYRYRHIVPPGITGWAQVNQGHVAELEQVNFKLQYDFFYIKNFSPWLDALIVARTIQTVLSGFGSR
jgi:lipopolysaccharide/colanic/teichoic acid biosynthesis glycosyltransferase